VRSGRSIEAVLKDPSAFEFYLSTSLMVAGLLFYLQEGFYRVFAPALLMICLMQVARKDYKRLAALLTVNIVFFSAYMNYYGNIGNYRLVESDYPRTITEDLQLQARIEQNVVYDPQANNPWCNTLLIPLKYYDSRLMMIPPGVGISYILSPETFRLPIKSRYALLDSANYEKYGNGANLELLSSLPIGDLYLNRDVDCSANR